MDKDVLAHRFGLQSYDTALPQEWCDWVSENFGWYPPDFAIVWYYDLKSIWGFPVALDLNAALQLANLLRNPYNAR